MRKDKNDIGLEDILTDRSVESELLEVPLAEKVFWLLSFLVLGVSGLVIFQLLNIGVFKHVFYEARAIENMSDVKITQAPRGLILDRFGKPLVLNEPTLNVFLAPQNLSQNQEERLSVLKQISSILNLSESELNQAIEEKRWDLDGRLFLTNNLTDDQLLELKAVSLPALRLEPGFKRVHKKTYKFSHVIGYTGRVNNTDLEADESLTAYDEIGRAGLEAAYDDYLRGTSGKEIILRDAKGKIFDERVISLPKPGEKVKTFIDRDLQEYFYDSLSQILRNLGRDIGVGIALNPKNGEVLSLVSIPGYDPALIAKSLNDPRKPLFNRAVSGLYSPGSTIKPLVATAALAEGIIDPLKQIFSAGFIEIPNPYDSSRPSRFLDWKAHGWVDLKSALARSSNVYFYEVGGGFDDQKGLGIDRLKNWWDKFGLAEKTNIDIPGEKSGFLPDPAWKEKETSEPWRVGDTYNVSIGQGDLGVTPIELLNYISAVANGGKFYEPRIMAEIQDSAGETSMKSEPILLKDLSSEIGEILPKVRQGMEDAVKKSYGTANLLSVLPMEIAAKTGSAQIENNAKTNAFFAGFAPAKDPEIAILILVENAREGSLNVVPVAKDIFKWYYENRLNTKINN